MRFTVGKVWDSKLIRIQHTFILLVITVSFAFKWALSLLEKPLPVEIMKVNINTATEEQLKKIPYIGEKTAKRIMKLREEKGFFLSIEELKGIRNYSRFKKFIKVD